MAEFFTCLFVGCVMMLSMIVGCTILFGLVLLVVHYGIWGLFADIALVCIVMAISYRFSNL